MKKAIFVSIVGLLISSQAFAMGNKPSCDSLYGNWMKPNYQYQFGLNAAASAWNPDGSFNYKLDDAGNKIPNPIGTASVTPDGRVALCNGQPITEYGVVCYDPSKISYNQPKWLGCQKTGR